MSPIFSSFPSRLQVLETLDGYRRYFMDVAFWQRYVRQVCWAHRLGGSGLVRGGVVGTYPTFIVDERWVVKFFGRLFDGQASFQVERAAAELLAQQTALPVPGLAAAGELFAHGPKWHWPYLVYAYVPGISLGEVYAQVGFDDRLRLAVWLGEATRRLHALPLPQEGVFAAASWEEYRGFMQAQRALCVENHRRWGHLSPGLAEQLAEFLPLLVEAGTLPGEQPHLIHADLTADHVLGRLQGGRWQTLGIIDWGDSRVGSLLYELVALHLDLFRGDKRLLRAYLEAYGLPPAWREDFARRAMATTLLHQFDVLAGVSKRCCMAGSLDVLADDLWGI